MGDAGVDAAYVERTLAGNRACYIRQLVEGFGETGYFKEHPGAGQIASAEAFGAPIIAAGIASTALTAVLSCAMTVAGVPAGATLVLNESAPADGEVMKVVASGKVPPEAITVFHIADREAAQAGFSNDVRLGNLPQRQ